MSVHKIYVRKIGCFRSHEIMLYLYSLMWYRNYVRSTDIVLFLLNHEIILFCGVYM